MPEVSIPYWHALTSPEAEAFAARDPVLILPVASTEQHGPHLPLSTDLDIGLGLLGEAFRRLPDDVPARVLPPVSIGCSGEHAHFAGTVSLAPHTMQGLIDAAGVTATRAGVRRLVISNSHGGNRHAVDMAALCLRARYELLVITAHYFLFPPPAESGLPEGEWKHGLHGGAVETAMMLFLEPGAVRRDAIRNASSLGEMLEGVLRTVSPSNDAASFAWLAQDLNANGITGDARRADAALGRRLVEHYGERLAWVIEDARRFPIERLGHP